MMMMMMMMMMMNIVYMIAGDSLRWLQLRQQHTPAF
jgi:hypothetical protein